MKILLNGKELTISDVSTVADLLKSLDKNPKFLAVEKNRELVPRTQHADCELEEGDEIEIVTLVGGG